MTLQTSLTKATFPTAYLSRPDESVLTYLQRFTSRALFGVFVHQLLNLCCGSVRIFAKNDRTVTSEGRQNDETVAEPLFHFHFYPYRGPQTITPDDEKTSQMCSSGLYKFFQADFPQLYYYLSFSGRLLHSQHTHGRLRLLLWVFKRSEYESAQAYV